MKFNVGVPYRVWAKPIMYCRRCN